MKAFIFIFALIACLMLVRGLPLEEETIHTTGPTAAAAAEVGAAIPITKPKCMAVGELCTRSDDCCTLRCHSYLAHCVT